MSSWFERFHASLWLRPDVGGDDEADYIRRSLRLRAGQCVLDSPCGAGRVTWHLAARGIHMVGIDRNPLFIRRARARFKRTGVVADLRRQDLRHVQLAPRSLHAVFNWFNSFGYFSEAENRDLVRSWAAALRPGGRLLIESLNRERILRNFLGTDINHGIRMTGRWDAATQTLTSQRHISGIAARDSVSVQRLYTPTQLSRLVQGAGLQVEALQGSQDGEPFRRSAPRLILIARKPR